VAIYTPSLLTYSLYLLYCITKNDDKRSTYRKARHMNRTQALAAYNRISEWEKRQTDRLNKEILDPYFGHNMCRMHNCRVNYQYGIKEWPVNGKNHAELVELADLYDYRQRCIWDTYKRLSAHFAQYFYQH
jgi:hypothetical protein